jgi:hypothetical protein
MNQFYQVVDLIKSRLFENPNVNTVIFGRTEDKDLYKKNIYPLVHINPMDVEFTTSQVCNFSFEIAALDQRDISKNTQYDKFEGNDDLQDNLNVTFAILNDLITWLRTQNNEFFIELAAVQTAQPVLFKDYNLLDGWVVQLTFKMPNSHSHGSTLGC